MFAFSSPTQAFGPSSKFSFAILRHGGGTFNAQSAGLRRIAWEVAKRTSIEVTLEPTVLDLTNPDLFRHPFLVLSGDGAFPPFTDAEQGALRRYLNYGGFLLIDDASGQPGGEFERSARRELAAALPTATVGRIPRDHVLYKAFYLLDGPEAGCGRRPMRSASLFKGGWPSCFPRTICRAPWHAEASATGRGKWKAATGNGNPPRASASTS